MLSSCLKYKKTSKNPKLSKPSNGKIIILPKYVVVKNQGLSTNKKQVGY